MNARYMASIALSAMLLSGPASALDAKAADKLVRVSKCLTCHAVDRKRDGPSFKETAAKYKGKPEGEDAVRRMITEAKKVKVDGDEEDHKPLKSTDPAEVSNVVQWILSM